MSDQLFQNIESIVEDIFKKKEEAEMRAETEAALNKAAETIAQLNESLEAKDDEHLEEVTKLQDTIKSLEEQLKEISESKKDLEDEKTKFEEEKARFEEEKTNLTQKAESAEQELENIKKDQLATSRMSELESVGVASNDKDSQIAKVREMSDDDFESYKSELVSVREAVIAQLRDGDTNTNDDNNDLADAAVSVQDSIDPLQAASAGINLELDTASDMSAKYKELGSQMANNIKDSRK